MKFCQLRKILAIFKIEQFIKMKKKPIDFKKDNSERPTMVNPNETAEKKKN